MRISDAVELVSPDRNPRCRILWVLRDRQDRGSQGPQIQASDTHGYRSVREELFSLCFVDASDTANGLTLNLRECHGCAVQNGPDADDAPAISLPTTLNKAFSAELNMRGRAPEDRGRTSPARRPGRARRLAPATLSETARAAAW